MLNHAVARELKNPPSNLHNFLSLGYDLNLSKSFNAKPLGYKNQAFTELLTLPRKLAGFSL